jgi:hypothetical protein
MGIWYIAPSTSLVIGPTGKAVMQYDYGTSSDERVKTFIPTLKFINAQTLSSFPMLIAPL